MVSFRGLCGQRRSFFFSADTRSYSSSDGRYIDLTGGKKRRLSKSRAAAEFAATYTPIDPSTIIPLADAAAHPITTDDPCLLPLRESVSDTMASLRRTLNELAEDVNMNIFAREARKMEIWNARLNNIIQDMQKIQDFATEMSNSKSSRNSKRRRT